MLDKPIRRFSTGTTLSRFRPYEWECKFLTQNVVKSAYYNDIQFSQWYAYTNCKLCHSQFLANQSIVYLLKELRSRMRSTTRQKFNVLSMFEQFPPYYKNENSDLDESQKRLMPGLWWSLQSRVRTEN